MRAQVLGHGVCNVWGMELYEGASLGAWVVALFGVWNCMRVRALGYGGHGIVWIVKPDKGCGTPRVWSHCTVLEMELSRGTNLRVKARCAVWEV